MGKECGKLRNRKSKIEEKLNRGNRKGVTRKKVNNKKGRK